MSAQMQPSEAEVGALDLVINSLYQHREIFLRELISNASDACDRLRYAGLSELQILRDDPELKIVLVPDPGPRHPHRTGQRHRHEPGRSRRESARSRARTQRFVQQLSGDSASDLNLIGQFGVGFYSAFMAASRIEVVPAPGREEHSWRWTSDGRSGFTIEAMAEPAARGTAVTLHLRDDAKEFLDEWRPRQIVRNYSDHIAVPILLEIERKGNGEAKEGGRRGQGTGAGQPGERAVDPAQIGHHRRAARKEPYHHVAHAFDEPWARLRRQSRRRGVASGAPVRAGREAVRPVRPAAPARRQAVRQARVHHRRPGRADAALPALRARVDSEDLQLNVSRETLQHSLVLAKIRKDLIKRARRAGAPGQGGGRRLRRVSGRTSARCSRKASTRTMSSASGCSSSPGSAAPRASWSVSPITSPG